MASPPNVAEVPATFSPHFKSKWGKITIIAIKAGLVTVHIQKAHYNIHDGVWSVHEDIKDQTLQVPIPTFTHIGTGRGFTIKVMNEGNRVIAILGVDKWHCTDELDRDVKTLSVSELAELSHTDGNGVESTFTFEKV